MVLKPAGRRRAVTRRRGFHRYRRRADVARGSGMPSSIRLAEEPRRTFTTAR